MSESTLQNICLYTSICCSSFETTKKTYTPSVQKSLFLKWMYLDQVSARYIHSKDKFGTSVLGRREYLRLICFPPLLVLVFFLPVRLCKLMCVNWTHVCARVWMHVLVCDSICVYMCLDECRRCHRHEMHFIFVVSDD